MESTSQSGNLVLKAMEDLQYYIEQEYPDLVTKSSSLVDVVKDIFQALNEGQESKYVISVHQGLSNFGIMSAIAFSTALLADLFLLPSMCLVFKATFKTEEQVANSTKSVAA